jgi:hypothetical protein
MLYALLLRLALAVRHVGVLAGGLRVALRFHRFFLTLGMFAFAVMFGSSPMAFRGVFVMFRRLGMSFLRHAGSPWFELRCLLNAVSVVIVPAKTRDLCGKSISWKVAFSSLDRWLVHWNIGGANALRGQ